ncbi:MAG: hypothetical protein K0S79_55 [Nitrospira sp.]|nr:hypothetical protein [Nitrospira sp.]
MKSRLNNPSFAKLTEPMVRAIKSRLRAGELPKNLAADYGVGVDRIHAIRKRRAWYWVKDLEPTTQGAFGQARPQQAH